MNIAQFNHFVRTKSARGDAWTRFLAFIDKYSIIVSGVVIYIYFLLSSLDVLRSRSASRSWVDFVLQFDSLIFLWLIALVAIQLQRYRQRVRDQEEYQRKVQYEFDRQRTKLKVVEEITSLLQDNINNPLAIISLNSQKLRRKLDGDGESTQLLDSIDNGLQRVHSTINDIKAYQTQKIVHESFASVDETSGKEESIGERIRRLAEARKAMQQTRPPIAHG